MSRETWEIVQESGIKNVEIQLALQCAPLIAGLKISNLFQISIEDYIQVLKILKNSRIMIYPLGVKGNQNSIRKTAVSQLMFCSCSYFAI